VEGRQPGTRARDTVLARLPAPESLATADTALGHSLASALLDRYALIT
jgi:hypothetical protein